MFKHLLILILMFSMVLSGLPMFSPEDATRDTMLDLKDAILLVKDFARTAENPADFSASVKRVVSALHAAAGLKTVIKAVGGPKSTVTPVTAKIHYLGASFQHPFPSTNGVKIPEPRVYYKSIDPIPDSPPPEHRSVC